MQNEDDVLKDLLKTVEEQKIDIELEEQFDMSVQDLSAATEKLVLGLVERHQFGNTRKIPESVMKELMKDSDDLELLKMSKNLVDPEDLKEWATLFNQAYSIMNKKFVQFNKQGKEDEKAEQVNKALGIQGVQFMTRAKAIRVKKELDELIKKADVVRDKIGDNWESIMAKAKPVLEAKGIYNESEYPKSIRNKLSISYKFYTIGMAKNLADFDSEIYEDELKKWHETMNNARAENLMFWRDAAQTVLDDAVEVLNGTKKVIRNEKIEKFKVLQKFFEEESLYGDNDLKKIISKCVEVMEGVDAGMLRDSETLRTEKLNKLNSIKDILKNNTEKLQRTISLPKKKAA